jgi:hypothetical protein
MALNTTKDAIEQARRDAQGLYKRAHNATAAKHADIRAKLETVADEASRIQPGLRDLAKSQQADARQHLKNALTAVEAAARSAQFVKTANEQDLKELDAALRSRTSAALKALSLALAARRMANG